MFCGSDKFVLNVLKFEIGLLDMKMDSLVSGLKTWRRRIRSLLPAAEHECEHCRSFDDYLEPLSSLHNFGDHVCPCTRHANGRRNLKCVNGSCRECARPFEHLATCEGEEEVANKKDVKYKWLRPIKIGNRNEEEWAWQTKPYGEFMKFSTSSKGGSISERFHFSSNLPTNVPNNILSRFCQYLDG